MSGSRHGNPGQGESIDDWKRSVMAQNVFANPSTHWICRLHRDFSDREQGASGLD
jgi:hypothetical protein